jgi:hypothetical protein
MAEYLRITTAIGEIIAAAHRIGGAGNELSGDVEGYISDIEAAEGDDKLGRDHFGTEFRKGTYHQPTATGDGKTLPANEALKQATRLVGENTTHLGHGVAAGLVLYEVADADGAADIGSIRK